MALLDQIQQDVKVAMKAGEKDRVGALRLIADALQKAAKDGSKDDEVAVLQRERKRRVEAAEAYREGGRSDLADQEEREAGVIDAYMPEQISDADLDAIVGDAVAQSGADSPRDMGKVMSLVMPQVQGRADGKRVSAAVKEKLV
ncbi:MAG: GatB/YqeY domain-containing protein [Thermoleophilaceae bacterium]|nr:GatB/YqeY domain-containing protein [Thermoleophilaceae bacterium]